MRLLWVERMSVPLVLSACGSRPPLPSASEASPPTERVAEPQPNSPPWIQAVHHLEVSSPASASYDREAWAHWTDEDGDCQDTRQEVLIVNSRAPVTLDESRCHVTTGHWVCPYTGAVFTDPRQLDVDHVVPLANAFSSGAHDWDPERRRRYANALEPGHLMVVASGANRTKGARGPEQWLPPHADDRCSYIEDWIRIKITWSLRASPAELSALEHYAELCQRGEIPEVIGEPIEQAPRKEGSQADLDDPRLRSDLDPTIRAAIEGSLEAYEGACPCPYSTMRNGRRCGGRSAWSRRGARAPLCYPDDVRASSIP